MKSSYLLLSAAALSGLAPLAAHAQVIFTDNFNTAASAASYNVFQTTGASAVNTGSAGFAFDYSALGIPHAPNGADTLGLRVQSDQTASTTSDGIGAISVATKALGLGSAYKVQVDVWGNYIGGTSINDAGGTNGTTGATIATGVKGATYTSATTNSGSQEGGFETDTVRDPSASGGTYRVYINGTNQANTTPGEGYYAAATSNMDATGSQYTNAYYASKFPAVSAPTAQSSAASTQTGTTPAGTFGFAWHTVTITNDGTSTVWAIDGFTIATVADSLYTAGGGQISLGDQDGNTGAGSTTAQQLYNFDLYDNLTVTQLPEPGSLAVLALGGIGMLTRRRA